MKKIVLLSILILFSISIKSYAAGDYVCSVYLKNSSGSGHYGDGSFNPMSNDQRNAVQISKARIYSRKYGKDKIDIFLEAFYPSKDKRAWLMGISVITLRLPLGNYFGIQHISIEGGTEQSVDVQCKL